MHKNILAGFAPRFGLEISTLFFTDLNGIAQ